MQEHFHYTKSSIQLQRLYERIHKKIKQLYDHLTPKSIRLRRNVDKQIQKDSVLIAVCLLGKMMGFTSERAWHTFIKSNLFCNEPFPERSRYHRICQQLYWVIKFLRYQFTRRFVTQSTYTIIDSMPLPLCHSARAFRTKRLRGFADYGYCASKREHYYGFKGSFQITSSGFIVSYVISAASVHDTSVVKELVEQSPHPVVLGDKGYVGRKLYQQLKRSGIHLFSLQRSNSKYPLSTEFTHFIRFHRKQIETLFSGLCDVFHLHLLKPRSLYGYELAIDSILFAHSLLVSWAIKDNQSGTKWKSQIFN